MNTSPNHKVILNKYGDRMMSVYISRFPERLYLRLKADVGLPGVRTITDAVVRVLEQVYPE